MTIEDEDDISFNYTQIPLCIDDDNDFMKIDVASNIHSEGFRVFNELRTACQLCDISIVADGKRLSAHRVVLSAVVPYFRGMFTLDMIEATMNEVSIPGISYETMELLIGYIYTGELRISTINVQSIMIGANFLQLNDLVNICAKFILSRLHPSNCLSIRDFLRTIGCDDIIIQEANTYIAKLFLLISKEDDFLRLDVEDIMEFLRFDNLYVDSEEEVYEIAVKWLKAGEGRQQYAEKILSCVRLPLLSPQYISTTVATNPTFRNNIECRDLIDEAKDYHLIPERRSSYNAFRVIQRTGKDIPGLVVAIGGLTPGESKSSVEIYDPSTKKWAPVKGMVTLRTRVGVAVHNRQVYAIGGFDGNDRLTLVEKFNYDSLSWTTLPPLTRKRSALAAAFVGRQLYVCGGYDGLYSLSSIEIFDIDKNIWEDGPEMNKQRSAAGVATIGKYIYVCGGHDGMEIFSNVERLNTDTGIWECVKPMINKRCRFGATAFKGKIYVAGGYDGSNFLRSVEVFDPETNIWSPLSAMNMRRSRVSLVATSECIHAIAGFDGENNLCSIEEYDEVQDLWVLGTPMATHEGGVGVGVIPIPPTMLS